MIFPQKIVSDFKQMIRIQTAMVYEGSSKIIKVHLLLILKVISVLKQLKYNLELKKVYEA